MYRGHQVMVEYKHADGSKAVHYLLAQENLFHGRNVTRTFDLISPASHLHLTCISAASRLWLGARPADARRASRSAIGGVHGCAPHTRT